MSGVDAVVALCLLALVAACAYLAAWMRPSVLVSALLVAEAFNPHLELPVVGVGPDRFLLAATAVAVAVQWRAGLVALRVRSRAVHGVLAAAAAYVALNAAVAGTLTGDGFFALLDRFGVVPFAAFAAAPLLFPTRRDRDILLGTLVGLGAYLAVVAWGETLGIPALVQPAWIGDPEIGIHFGRARGPFLEAVANGMALFACAVASAVARRTWSSPDARRAATVAGVLCLSGTVLTLTRSIWLATAVAAIVALAAERRTRRLVVPAAGLAGAAVVLLLLAVPGLGDRAEERSQAQLPLWDRLNSNAAALSAVEHNPLFGIGWQRFREDGDAYYRQADERPLTTADIEVHNVPLSHATELGLVGLALWASAAAAAIGGAVLRRPTDELRPWRQALVALAVHWAVVAAVGPLSYPFPNLLLWLWAGVVSVPVLGARAVADVPAVAREPIDPERVAAVIARARALVGRTV
jgi:O-antigen ligase